MQIPMSFVIGTGIVIFLAIVGFVAVMIKLKIVNGQLLEAEARKLWVTAKGEIQKVIKVFPPEELTVEALGAQIFELQAKVEQAETETANKLEAIKDHAAQVAQKATDTTNALIADQGTLAKYKAALAGIGT